MINFLIRFDYPCGRENCLERTPRRQIKPKKSSSNVATRKFVSKSPYPLKNLEHQNYFVRSNFIRVCLNLTKIFSFVAKY